MSDDTVTQADLEQGDAACKAARREALVESGDDAFYELLARNIQTIIDRARASRDQSEMTRRTMLGIEVGEINP